MDQHLINRAFEGFNRLTALVIGDVMIDAYYWGRTERISPEAPVPIVSVTQTENRLGGAANVALNVQALGATALLCSVVGDDAHADLFDRLLEAENLDKAGMVRDADRITTVKTRIISQQQQMLRVDEEITTPLTQRATASLIERVQTLVTERKVDVIVFEDYDKGVITPELIESVVALAREHQIPVTVDPKKVNFTAYRDVTLFKPNLKELREGLKLDLETIDALHLTEAVNMLKEYMPFQSALITLSEHGVYINSEEGQRIIPAHVRNVADVSGAGDTVISVASLCLAMGLGLEFAARLANLAGGLVCEKVGVVPVDKQQLEDEAMRLSK